MTPQKIISLFIKFAMLIAFIASFGVVGAHTGLKVSTPAHEATVQTPPAEINLEFNGPVRLVKFNLMADDQKVFTGFKLSADAVATFAIATPGLKAGRYTAEWAAIGEDGHTVSNSFNFVVSGNPATASR